MTRVTFVIYICLSIISISPNSDVLSLTFDISKNTQRVTYSLGGHTLNALSSAQALSSLFSCLLSSVHPGSRSHVEIRACPLHVLPGIRGQHRSDSCQYKQVPITEQVSTQRMTRTSRNSNSYCGRAKIWTSPRLCQAKQTSSQCS